MDPIANPDKNIGKMSGFIGNDRDEALVADLFIATNYFADLLRRHGDEFAMGDIRVTCENGVHMFWHCPDIG